MLGEIDKDFYCSANRPINVDGDCLLREGLNPPECYPKNCSRYHRKHPTPEQYKEEYGREVPDDFPVLIQLKDHTGWLLAEYKQAKTGKYFYWKRDLDVTAIIVCCTPFGKPGKDWRPV